MTANTAPRTGRRNRRLLAVAVAAVGLAVTGGGVYAALNATAFNSSAQGITSGTLSLTMADNGAGFNQSVANLAPGDTVNRYVTLTQGGSLDANNLTLGVADATPTKLTTDAVNGLHVTVTQCVGGVWAPSTGVCTGSGSSTTVLLSNSALSALAAMPAAVVPGAVTASTVLSLKVAVTLPDQTETTTNGVPPVNTIQGLSASLTWTFADTQRTATTTNG